MTEFAIALASGVDSANRMRLALSGLVPDIGSLKSRSGLLDGGGVVTLTSGMGVSVSPFRGYVQGASGSTQGGYFVCSDAAKALTFADGGGTNRTDLIVGRLYHDAFDASGQTKFAVEIFQGTPGAGTPATPANCIKLAEKVITAGMSAGTGGLGTVPVDKRPPQVVAKGGIVPVVDAADRDTLAVYDGLTVHRLDQKLTEQRVNGTWRPQGGGTRQFVRKTVAEPVTSSTAMQNDDVLKFDVIAGRTYKFEALLHVIAASSAANGDIKVGFTFPAGTMDFMAVGPNGVSLATATDATGEWLSRPGATSGTSTIPLGVSQSTNPVGIAVMGTFVATADGTVQLQWAQGASSANASKVLAGSSILADLVA